MAALDSRTFSAEHKFRTNDAKVAIYDKYHYFIVIVVAISKSVFFFSAKGQTKLFFAKRLTVG